MNTYLYNEARAHYEERLRVAEERRRARLNSTPTTGLFDRLRIALGDYLIAFGQQLKLPARTVAR